MPSSGRMLIVDDEPSVGRTLQLIFEREGYEVTLAPSALKARAVLTANAFDVVMTDLNMERDDIGLEVVKAAKLLPAPPITVICTGYATVHNAKSALEMHVDHFALKPIELKDLIYAVRRLVAQRGGKGPEAALA